VPNPNKEIRESIQASKKVIEELKVNRDEIVVQIKVEQDKIDTLRSELSK
jgi:hypothetical protein